MMKKHEGERTIYRISTSPLRVCDIPEKERPREIVDRIGVENAQDHVLIAILLRSGIQGVSVIELAYEVLKKFGSLKEVALASVDEIGAIKGMGKVRAQVLKAGLELGQRIQDAGGHAVRVTTPEQAASVIFSKVRNRLEESFWLLLLDAKNKLCGPPKEVSRGILDASLVHPREVFREAIRSSCAAVIVAHNHPSGEVQPSAEDLKVTRQLIECGKIVDIRVLDHIILASGKDNCKMSFLSMREDSVLNFGE